MVHWYFEPGVLLSKEGRTEPIQESISSWQKETRLLAGIKKHPVTLNAAAQLDTRHCYHGQLTDAITATD